MSQKAGILNQMLKTQNRQKVLQILSAPDIESILKIEDESKYTPLFWACSSLSQNVALEIVPMMLQKGADPYKKDLYRQNVLYYIAKHGKDKLMKYMLEKFQYNLNENDQTNQTPIYFSASNNHIKTTQILLDHGANINHVDSNGQNCLYWAAKFGHIQMCKFLVEAGIDYNKIDHNKETALHYAKKNKQQQVMRYLTELKNMAKKTKQMNKMVQESSQQESKGPRKKKEMLKTSYCLIYTNQRGEVHELTPEELEKFGQASEKNRKILQFIHRPDKLDSYPVPEEKKYEKIANKILNHFIKHEQGGIFMYPVDPIALNIPHYPTIIKQPMDFTTIKNKLTYNAYDSEIDFNRDMNLVFDNCVTFNGKQSSYGKIATQMRLQFNTMYKKQFGI